MPELVQRKASVFHVVYVAKRAVDFILELYRVERAALGADVLGTPAHLDMRQTRSQASSTSSKPGSKRSRVATLRAVPSAAPSRTRWGGGRSSSSPTCKLKLKVTNIGRIPAKHASMKLESGAAMRFRASNCRRGHSLRCPTSLECDSVATCVAR